MSTPNQPDPYSSQPYQPPGPASPYNPGYPNPPAAQPGYPNPPAAYPGYPTPGYAVDPSAPYGRDPATGEPLSDKSALAAGLLQIFFGVWGVGRFYIGSTTIAALQLGATILSFILIFVAIGVFTLPCVAIWALIDGIMMLTGSVKDGQGRKLRSGG